MSGTMRSACRGEAGPQQRVTTEQTSDLADSALFHADHSLLEAWESFACADGECERRALAKLICSLFRREKLDAVEIQQAAHQIDGHTAALLNLCLALARFVLAPPDAAVQVLKGLRVLVCWRRLPTKLAHCLVRIGSR